MRLVNETGDVENYGSASSGEGASNKHLALRTNSTYLTAGLVIADVVGAGILSMANAFAHFGWLAGTFMTVLLMAMNYHICILMWRVYMKYKDARTYMDLASCVCDSMSDSERDRWVSMVAFVQYSFIFAMLCIYSLSLGKGIGMMNFDLHLCLPTWTAIGCIAIIPFFMTARRLGSWPTLIWVNVATILGSIIIPIAVMISMGVEQTRPKGSEFVAIVPPDVSNWLPGTTTMTFAFTSQFMITEILAEMEDCEEFPRAYGNFSVPFQLLAFLIVGLGGYYYKGSSVNGMIMDNMGFGTLFQLACLCMVVHMVITFLIKAIVLGRAWHRRLSREGVDDDTPQAWMTWTSVVGAIMVISYTVANIVPFFEDFVDLLGATFTPMGCFIIPIMIYWKLLPQLTEKELPSSFERTVIWIEMIFSIFVTIVGTYTAARNIYEKWDTYGGPFGCHCEDLWRTCECSGRHLGMEHCKLPPLPEL